MPGRPTPTRRADLLSGQDPRTSSTVHVQAPRPDSQAETSRAIEQLDRRLARPQQQQPPCAVQPDEPGLPIGWFWFDTSSTAEAP